MTTYSVMVLDAVGLIEGELELDFDNDEQAIATIFRADSLFGCELWCGDRWLGLFPSPRLLRPIAPQRVG